MEESITEAINEWRCMVAALDKDADCIDRKIADLQETKQSLSDRKGKLLIQIDGFECLLKRQSPKSSPEIFPKENDQPNQQQNGTGWRKDWNILLSILPTSKGTAICKTKASELAAEKGLNVSPDRAYDRLRKFEIQGLVARYDSHPTHLWYKKERPKQINGSEMK